jgi:hypothetical protein
LNLRKKITMPLLSAYAQIIKMSMIAAAITSASVAHAAPPQDDGGQFSWIRAATTACAAGDFPRFFEAFAKSAEVREEYTAANVTMTTGKIKRTIRGSDYRAFPIGMIDNSWVSSLSAMRLAEGIDKPFEYMSVKFNTSSNNRVRIDYTQVTYALGSPSEGGDDVETPNKATPVGKPGYVIFYPTKDCWELVQHTSGSNARGPK